MFPLPLASTQCHAIVPSSVLWQIARGGQSSVIKNSPWKLVWWFLAGTFAHTGRVSECHIHFSSLSISLNQHGDNQITNLSSTWTNSVSLSMFRIYLLSCRELQSHSAGLGPYMLHISRDYPTRTQIREDICPTQSRDNLGTWGDMDPCMVYTPHHGKDFLPFFSNIWS